MTETCPNCRSDEKIIHYWRVEMRTLTTVDDYKCLSCGHRWETRQQARKLPIER